MKHYADDISALIGRAKRKGDELTFPSDRWYEGEITNDVLLDAITRASALRERAAAVLSDMRTLLITAEEMVTTQGFDMRTTLDGARVSGANSGVTQGFAWGERESAANLSVIEDMIALRRSEQGLTRFRDIVREADDKYRAWRDREWTLDRVLRLQQLRSHMGEV